jgi:hypothetical protein
VNGKMNEMSRERNLINGLLAVLVTFCSCSRENGSLAVRIQQPIRNVIVIANSDDLSVANAIQSHLRFIWGVSRLVMTSEAEGISASQRESIARSFQVDLDRIPSSVLPMTYRGIREMRICKLDDFDINNEKRDSNEITNIEVWSPYYLASDKAIVVARYQNFRVGDATSAFLVSLVRHNWIVSEQVVLSFE